MDADELNPTDSAREFDAVHNGRGPDPVDEGLRPDDRLASERKAALIAVYDSMLNTGHGGRDL